MDEQQKTDRPEDIDGKPEMTAAEEAVAPETTEELQADGNTQIVDSLKPENVAPDNRRQAKTGGVKPGVVAVLCIALVLVTAVASAAVWRADTPWVATVNGEKITEGELYDVMYANVGPDALQNLVTERLIAQEAKAQNVSVGKEELEERMNTLITRQFGSEEQFEQLLAMYNMSRADFEEQIETQITVEKILAPSIKLDDSDLAAYFKDNRDRFNKPAEVELRHILSETKEEAEEVRAAIADGADFAATAKEQSIDEATAAQGGAMGRIRHDNDLPAWLLSAFELTPGRISQVVEGDDGFHVMEVVNFTPAAAPELKDVKDEVRQAALEEKMTTLYPKWLGDLHENADIKYRE